MGVDEMEVDDPKINKIIDKKVIEYQDQNDEVLDWRNNDKDRETLMNWWKYNIQLTENYLNKPCRIWGDPIRICTQNPETDHFALVVGEDGKIIGESERLVEDDNGNVIEKGGLYDKDTLSLSNVDKMENV